MRTSPLVGGSSPPIIRSSVVLPHPEGPSSTRNSPSAEARSMPSTAATPSKRLLRSRTSTTAMASRVVESWSRGVETYDIACHIRAFSWRQSLPAIPVDCLLLDSSTSRLLDSGAPTHEPLGAPLVEDSVDLRFRLGDRVRGRLLPGGGTGHHVRQGRQGKDLAD